MSDGAPRFIADCMLGRLARWLRVLGFDTAYERSIRDSDLVERALSEGRILLTRDTRLVLRRRMPTHLLIRSQETAEQVRQTLDAFHLRPDAGALLSRCLICNRATERISREEARPEVPPYVFESQKRFARCPQCGRIYWRATHVADIVERLGGIAPAAGEDEG